MPQLFVIGLVALLIVAAALHATGRRSVGCWLLVIFPTISCVVALAELAGGPQRIGQSAYASDEKQLGYISVVLVLGLLAAVRPKWPWLFWIVWALNGSPAWRWCILRFSGRYSVEESILCGLMIKTADGHDSILGGVHVIDGGLASELEYVGAHLDGPLWSAHVLEDEPERLAAVHRAYIEAGAQCIATCSYQVSRMGYAEVGLSAERADAALLRSVELARSVVAEFPGPRVLVAGSLGPYGAALHNGCEYHGNYDCSYADLVQFHRERIEVFARASDTRVPDLHTNQQRSPVGGLDLLAFETFPSLEELRAVGEAMAPWPELQAWFSFSCRDDKHVSHGELVRDCAALAATLPQTVAIGVNCIPPKWIPSLIGELREGSDKPVLVYPNSGEGWDAAARSWTGTTDPADFGARSSEWFAAGAQIVGGCCRTRPEHIREVARSAGRIID
jgi:homocysteine S-methyltransferase